MPSERIVRPPGAARQTLRRAARIQLKNLA